MNLARLISELRNWAGAWRADEWTPPAYCETCSMTTGRPHCFWCPHARPLVEPAPRPVAEAAPHDHDRDLEDAYRQAEINVLHGWYAREATRYLDGCDRDGRWAE